MGKFGIALCALTGIPMRGSFVVKERLPVFRLRGVLRFDGLKVALLLFKVNSNATINAIIFSDGYSGLNRRHKKTARRRLYGVAAE